VTKNIHSDVKATIAKSSNTNLHDTFMAGINLYNERFSLLENNKKNQLEAFLFKIIDTASNKFKRKISKEVSILAHAPLKIIRYLALEKIAVAKPVLTHSTVLAERDLLVIINLRGNQHRAAIAARKDITFPVSYKLVEIGNEEIIRTLVANKNALISEKTFELIGDKITLKAEFEEIIATRKNISASSLKILLAEFSNSELLNILKNSNSKLQSMVKTKMENFSGGQNLEVSMR